MGGERLVGRGKAGGAMRMIIWEEGERIGRRLAGWLDGFSFFGRGDLVCLFVILGVGYYLQRGRQCFQASG